MEQHYVSIVIPVFNSEDTISAAIEACMKQDYPMGKIEIIVVDDGSTDNTRAIVKKYPVMYIYQKKSGPASARNNGYLNSKGEVLCFMDADCVPYKDWVSKLVRCSSMDNIGAVAGSYALEGPLYLLDKFVHCEIRYKHSRMPEYINSFGTYNVLVKRLVLEALNGFDPGYLCASGEDTDLSYRIIKAGYKIYFEKRALVSHRNILRFWKYMLVQFRHGYWRMKIYKKNISMITRDEYGYWKDFIEAYLALAIIAGCLFNFPWRFLFLAVASSCLFLIQIPLVVKISFEQKDVRYLGFCFVTFARCFSRVLGSIFGFVAFWIAGEQYGKEMEK